MLVLENNIAVLADFVFSSGVHSTIPKALFWFGQIINQTLSRTLITSVTTLLALFSIYIFGGAILKGFSFAMIIGVIVGTYSSIFVATPILNYTNVSQKTILKEDKENN